MGSFSSNCDYERHGRLALKSGSQSELRSRPFAPFLEMASCRRSFAPSLQLIGNLVDAGLRAIVVLARRPRDADRADDFVTHFDR
jgi:hypothetical protein